MNTAWNPPATTDLDIVDAWLREMGGTELAVHLDYAWENWSDCHGHIPETEEEKAQMILWAYDTAFYVWEEAQLDLA